jgi:CDP-diacylglycerol--glycerol-3-phosphate 3-phosphatidyltransferase
MGVTTQPVPATQSVIFNLPNQLTAARLLLSVVLFGFIAWKFWFTSLVLFLVAATTDALDGYLARKRGETTTLGRILDPFVDKVVMLGTFIFLLPVQGAGLYPWMVTILVAREMLVTVLRSFLEAESVAFGADWGGKIKMILQCIAASWILFHLGALAGPPPHLWSEWLRDILNWGTVAVTLASGVTYFTRAASIFRQRSWA